MEVVDINDGSLGRVRMAVLPTALLVREATGLDISMHFTCRDRNLMGIQATSRAPTHWGSGTSSR